MSPVVKEAIEQNSTVILRVTAVTSIHQEATVVVIYLCADETKQPYVLCQVRTATYQKYLDYFIDDQFNAVKPLWDECDDRTELIRICLRKVLQPAVESKYKKCNPTTLMLKLNARDITSEIPFRQQDHIIETFILRKLKPRVSIHMCNQQKREEVYFLSVCNQSDESLPPHTFGTYGYSIWFTKFILKAAPVLKQTNPKLCRILGMWQESKLQSDILKKVVSFESSEFFKDYDIKLIMISEVDTDIKVIRAYQPNTSELHTRATDAEDLIQVPRHKFQPEVDKIWSMMKESKGINSIYSLILRGKYARLVFA